LRSGRRQSRRIGVATVRPAGPPRVAFRANRGAEGGKLSRSGYSPLLTACIPQSPGPRYREPDWDYRRDSRGWHCTSRETTVRQRPSRPSPAHAHPHAQLGSPADRLSILLDAFPDMFSVTSCAIARADETQLAAEHFPSCRPILRSSRPSWRTTAWPMANFTNDSSSSIEHKRLAAIIFELAEVDMIFSCGPR
jgi:hypothetical protein